MLYVRFGSLADKPSRAKIHFCPLLPKSDHSGHPPISKLGSASASPFGCPWVHALVMRIPVVVPVVSVSVAVVVDGTAASSTTSHRVFATRSGTVLRYR
jgi:hypothetical protein